MSEDASIVECDAGRLADLEQALANLEQAYLALREDYDSHLRLVTAQFDEFRARTTGAVDYCKSIERRLVRGPVAAKRIRNAAAIAGLVAVGSGCWLIAPATALIVVGVILLGLPVIGTLAGLVRREPRDV